MEAEGNELAASGGLDGATKKLADVMQRPESVDANTVALVNRRLTWQFESNLYLDVARLMLSLLHAWNIDQVSLFN